MSFLSRILGRSGGLDLSPADYVAQRDPDAPVIDVRTPREFAAGHLQGAVNIDVMSPDFRDQIDALSLDAEAPVYLYCRTGNRSGQAARILRSMGYDEAYNVGGLNDLQAAGARAA